MGDAGIEHLREMARFLEFDLRQTKVTDPGLRWLGGMSCLQMPNFDGTETTSNGAGELQAELPNGMVTPDPSLRAQPCQCL